MFMVPPQEDSRRSDDRRPADWARTHVGLRTIGVMKSPRDGTSSDASRRNSIKPAVRFVARRYWRALSVMTGSAFLGGMTEAVFLVLVTRAAFAITDGKDEIGVVAGWFVSV